MGRDLRNTAYLALAFMLFGLTVVTLNLVFINDLFDDHYGAIPSTVFDFMLKVYARTEANVGTFQLMFLGGAVGYYLILPGGRMDQRDPAHALRRSVLLVAIGTTLFLIPVYVEMSTRLTKMILLVTHAVGAVVYLWGLPAVVRIFRTNLGEKKGLSEVSNIDPDDGHSFTFPTNKGTLSVHSPEQGTLVQAGAGGGKTASILVPYIYLAAKLGYAGFVYDFKGNPTTLGRSCYNAIKNASGVKTRFAIINYADLAASGTCNPVHPDYITKKMYAMNAAVAILTNLNKEWVRKKDFWADNAIAYLGSIIWYLRKNYPEYCTLPHACCMALSDFHGVLNLLNEDQEISKNMQPIFSAFKLNAEQQLAGVVSSLQNPMARIFTPEIFYVLSGKKSDELYIDLDISDPNNPTLLTVCNVPGSESVFSPVIALIATTCMQNMNQQGKVRSIFQVDEASTLHIPNFANLPATGRSNGICTMVGVQEYSQLEEMYGRELAKVLVGNFGNQFYGMTNDSVEAEKISRGLGEYDRVMDSVSESDHGHGHSQSYRKDRNITASEIMGLAPGEFVGKIAGGKPAQFHVQFDHIDHKEGPIEAKQLSIVKERNLSAAMQEELFSELADVNFKEIQEEIEAIIPERPAPGQ